uniref:Uncharacterized protein n=1 Tax=Pristionchus pacificus TaxID=54126 RepID=A0A2A6CHI2_PRIPA|eukprot:PDM77547.1 hypothetical protein PRIPAC_34414 [Pristionchus pacificus]
MLAMVDEWILRSQFDRKSRRVQWDNLSLGRSAHLHRRSRRVLKYEKSEGRTRARSETETKEKMLIILRRSDEKEQDVATVMEKSAILSPSRIVPGEISE